MSLNTVIKEAALDFRIEPWHAYEFKSEDISRLTKTASLYTGSPSTTNILFENGNSVSSDDPNVCLDDTNGLTSLIKNISITSSNYRLESGSRSISIDLKNTRVLSVAHIRGSGPKSAAVVVRSDIENILAPSKSWFSFIYYSSILQGVFITTLSLLLYGYLIYDFKRPVAAEVQIVLGLFSGIVIMLPIPFVVFRLYPRMSFAIGLGARRSALRRKIGGFVLGTVVCGLLVGVGGNFLTDKLKEKPAVKPEIESAEPKK